MANRTEYQGADLSTIFVPIKNATNRETCQVECETTADCRTYNFAKLWANTSSCLGIHNVGIEKHEHLVDANLAFHSGTKVSCKPCWRRRNNTNAVWGEIKKGPRTEERPDYFFFANATDRESCEAACYNETGCAAYAFTTSSFVHEEWRSQCYGISAARAQHVNESNVHSGYKAPCCWERHNNTNAVYGQIPTPESTNPPNYVYFDWVHTHHACEEACQAHNGCDAYAWHSPEFGEDDWKGRCYGIAGWLATDTSEHFVHSGYKTACYGN